LTQNKEFLETKATCNRQTDKQKTLLSKECFALFFSYKPGSVETLEEQQQQQK
jgi:hypothetical protein